LLDNVIRASLGELARRSTLSFGDGYRTRRDELGRPGYPILRVAQVADGSIRPDELGDHVRNEFRTAIGPKLSRVEDVVLTTKGTFGRRAYIRNDDVGYVYSPQVCFFRVAARDHLIPRYLYYWLGSEDFKSQVHGMKSQTDMADYLSLRDLSTVTIPIPPVATQIRVSEAMGVLDDKIDLNRKVSETLEAMARMLFKSWFVDFDPLRSKAIVKDSSLPESIAEHFSGPLVDSEVGEVPKGGRFDRSATWHRSLAAPHQGPTSRSTGRAGRTAGQRPRTWRACRRRSC